MVADDDSGEERLASRVQVQARSTGRHILRIGNIGVGGDFAFRSEEATDPPTQQRVSAPGARLRR